MPRDAHEHTINACLGERLRTLRRSWAEVTVYEETGHTSAGRPDVIPHFDGGDEESELAHTMSKEQIEWFRAGAALNILGK